MPEQYDNEMKIALFRNERRDNDKAPVMTGKVTVKGVEYDVALWGKESANGKKFWTGKIQLPRQKQQAAPQQQRQEPNFQDADTPF
jgi:uncharacterized protein (DUF736 family)